MRKIEILAPAGSLESLKAGINASCDAVYIGGSKFGARAYADNLQQDMLLEAIDYAHIHNKNIYLTVNTLLKNNELEDELFWFLHKYYKQGIDAVIVQDMGVLHFIHEHFPTLDIHASTQMTLTMAQGANTLKDMGVTRLVPSRELSIEEIKKMRSETDLEIETFVHGALCYCYSGQCLMSSMFGGRSGNRGRCAQPCRMAYDLVGIKKDDATNTIKVSKLSTDDEKYIISPKDICTLDLIPDLIEAGIDSFKIEGRMKRPEYAAITANTYRKYVDKYLELGKERYEAYLHDHKDEFYADKMNLMDIYNRGGFSEGYFHHRNGKNMMSLNRPNHTGVKIGKVKDVRDGRVKIHLEEDLNAGDILEIRGDMASYEFTSGSDAKKGDVFSSNYDRRISLKPGNLVYRTKNNQLLDDINKRFIKEDVKVEITGNLDVVVGEQLKITLQRGSECIVYVGDIVEPAKNQPMTEEKIRKQLLKTKDSNFKFQDLQINILGAPFIPVQKLNELRRNSIEALSSVIANSYRRNEVPREVNGTKDGVVDSKSKDFTLEKLTNNETNKLGIHVSVASKEQLMAACEVKEVSGIYIESDIVPLNQLLDLTNYVKQSGKKSYLYMPHIFRKTTYEYFLQNKNILVDDTIDGYIIRNLEEYSLLFNDLKVNQLGKDVINDYNLYVMNKEAGKAWNKMGISKHTAPVELNKHELKELSDIYYDMIVYGRIPLMVTAQCPMKTVTGGNNKPTNAPIETPCCGRDISNIQLVDRFNKKFDVRRHCRYCYNTIYNSQPLSLLKFEKEIYNLKPKNIRLNFTTETKVETINIIKEFVQAFLYKKTKLREVNDFTRGHFNRGIE